MVYERLSLPDCASGALLDGYPRTLTQAQSLDSLLAKVSGVLKTVLYLHVDRDLLIARLSGRWVCRSCGSVYHAEFRPTRLAGVCDACGGHLVQLPYDTADVQQRRINVYYERTEPLLEYYRTRELLAEIDGQQSIERVTRNLLQAIANAETDAGASE
jgi:adenylate kinase